MFASPGFAVEGGGQRRVASPAWYRPSDSDSASARTAARSSWRPGTADWSGAVAPWLPKIFACTAKWSQLVGLRVKFLRFEVDHHLAKPQRDAVEDLRQRIRFGGDLGASRVDMERRPDDDVAEVVGPGDRGRDHRKAERRTLVGTGEVDPCPAGRPGGCRRPPPSSPCRSGSSTGTLGAASSARPDGARGAHRGERRVRAVGDPGERGAEPGRGADVERAQRLFAVVAVEDQREGRVLGGGLVGDACLEGGLERPRRSAGRRCRPGRSSR